MTSIDNNVHTEALKDAKQLPTLTRISGSS